MNVHGYEGIQNEKSLYLDEIAALNVPLGSMWSNYEPMANLHVMYWRSKLINFNLNNCEKYGMFHVVTLTA